MTLERFGHFTQIPFVILTQTLLEELSPPDPRDPRFPQVRISELCINCHVGERPCRESLQRSIKMTTATTIAVAEDTTTQC